MILACQEQHLPGADLEEKWRFAVEAGFDGIELIGPAGFSSRLGELQAARDAGVAMPTVCVNGAPFIGDFTAEGRRHAVEHVRELIETMAACGGRGAITPAAYALFSRSLPPYIPPREAAEDREVLLEALRTLGARAAELGVVVLVEPLNRYEDHMLNRVEQAIDLCQAAGVDGLAVMADTYHMNIEESDLPEALRRGAPWVQHVHLSDSNRHEPGAGHVDFGAVFRALRESGFDGTMAFEGRLSGDAETVLPPMARRMRELWAAAG